MLISKEIKLVTLVTLSYILVSPWMVVAKYVFFKIHNYFDGEVQD